MKLNMTSGCLLGLLLDEGALTGGALLRLAQERMGDYWTMTRSQVYRELQSLSDAGYLAAGAPGGQQSRPYRLTADGERAFHAWLVQADPSNQVRLGLLVMVAFGRHLPAGRLQELLDEFEDEHRRRLAGYQLLDRHLAASNADVYGRATLSFGVHYEEAVLRWLDSLPAQVRRSSAGEVP